VTNEWKEFSIDELKSEEKNAIAMGPFGSNIKTDNFISSGVPIIRGGNLNGYKLIDKDFVYVSEEKKEQLKSSIARRGDIVITHRGTLGQVGIIPGNSNFKEYIVSQSQMKITLNRELVLPEFVFYFLKSNLGQEKLLLNVSQTGVPAIASPTSSIKAITLRVPSKEIQKKIVDNLEHISNKIELNNQMNETLEAMALAIFKEWFIDFGPVRAKAEGRRPFGMDYETAALFPDSFEESELGMIPKGWIWEELGSCISLIIDHRGKTPTKLGSEWRDSSNFKAYSAKNIKGNRLVSVSDVKFVDENLYKKWMKDEVKSGDILMTSEGPMGEFLFLKKDVKWLLSQRLYGIRADDKNCTSDFLFQWLQSDKAKHDLDSRSTGTTVTGIRQSELRRVKVLLPGFQLTQMFSRTIGDLYSQVWENQFENFELEKLRDLILPKLISGEISL